MTRIRIDRALAFASGQTLIDLRKQHLPQSKRAWTREDYADAASKTNALLLHVPFEEGGLKGLTFSYKMLDDLGVTAEQVLASGNTIEGHNGGPEA